MAKGLYRQEIYSNQKIKSALNFEFGDLDAMIEYCCGKFKD